MSTWGGGGGRKRCVNKEGRKRSGTLFVNMEGVHILGINKEGSGTL